MATAIPNRARLERPERHDPLESQSELHAFEETGSFARTLAELLELRGRTIEVHRFPDRESLIRVDSEGRSRAVIVRSLDDPNPKLVELLFAADALRRRGVGELVLVAPYLAYMRQDRVFREGEAVSQRVVAELLGQAFDEVLTIEAHLHRIDSLMDVFPCRARSLSAAPAIARWCGGERTDAVIVGPDEESEPWVRAVAASASLPFVVCRKTRRGDRDVEVDVPELPPGVQGALLVDDIASSGATLAATAAAVRARGVSRVEAIVVHALFSPGAETQLRAAGIDRIVSTDTIAHPSNAIGVAALLADALAHGNASKESV